MTQHSQLPHAKAGDWLDVQGSPGWPARRGQVVKVLGAPGHEHYLVRWDDGHESVYFPADGALHVVHPPQRRRKAGGARS